MKKILLIEDRIERQVHFTEDTGINLKSYSDIIDNKIYFDKNELEKYSIIITHRSAFGDYEENILDYLKKYCEKTNTKLVFFSGGISATYYSKTKYEFLLLNSKSFYNKNLKLFLEDMKNRKEANLLILAYGNNWRINMMLNTLAKINLFLDNNNSKEKVKFNNFKTVTKIENIDSFVDIQYPEVIKGGVLLEDLKNLASNITLTIRREVELYA